MKIPPSLTVALVLAGTLACASCNYDKPWAFGISSSVYEGKHLDQHSGPAPDFGDPRVAVVFLAICCAPFALDVVFLPITLTHDQIVCH